MEKQKNKNDQENNEGESPHQIFEHKATKQCDISA